MATKPQAPKDEYILRDIAYGQSSTVSVMTLEEFQSGRNNVGEMETPLGSMTNAHKDNYLFRYMTEHINYLTKMVQYLESEINTLKGG